MLVKVATGGNTTVVSHLCLDPSGGQQVAKITDLR